MLISLISACQVIHERNVCSNAWYASVEQRLDTSDGHGHGPDVGSDEWKSVVEFRLGLRGQPDLPDHESREWCRFISREIKRQ